MQNLWELYKGKSWVEPFLMCSIAVFIAITLMLFLWTINSRRKRITKRKLFGQYFALVENMLMAVLFQDSDYSSFKTNPEYRDLLEDKLFRKVMLRSVINLHQNYEGIYARKLEDFYFQSNLIQESFNKLKNRNWAIKCQGIKELSQMNVSKIFNTLVKISKSKNKILKITAINACIRLNRTDGIAHLVKHKQPLDLWTQLNIIEALKQGNIEHTSGIELLLESKNQTVVSLGLKIIKSLHLSTNVAFIEKVLENNHNPVVRAEAIYVIESFTNHNFKD